jgi:hypothetical protein
VATLPDFKMRDINQKYIGFYPNYTGAEDSELMITFRHIKEYEDGHVRFESFELIDVEDYEKGSPAWELADDILQDLIYDSRTREVDYY